MAAQGGTSRVSDHPGVRAAWNYPVLEAIFNRRSRRFAVGTEIPGGATKYRSDKPPMPLDEIEEAILIQAATGVSGLLLADLPYRDDKDRDAGGSTVIQFTGRTWASPCASHDTELFFWNDEGAYLAKFKDAQACGLREYETMDDQEKILMSFRENRIRLGDGRVEHPRNYPVMLPFNIWSSNVPGSTVFLPVTDVTFEYINLMLLMCGWPDGGFYFVDDENGNVPAGCERWAKEGLLNPLFTLPLSYFGTTVSTIETGFIMQNLMLTIQAMGLGGWVHAAPPAEILLGGTPVTKGLGFRFVTGKQGRGASPPTPSPVGIDGVFEAYCPPYYKDMNAAVDAVVAAKFGPDGIYNPASSHPAPFLAKNEFQEAVPRHSDKLVQCVKDICNYIYETYGKFPSHSPAMVSTGSWVQAHHLDLDFYDKFYGKAAYTETQARHMELWHGVGAERLHERVAATPV